MAQHGYFEAIDIIDSGAPYRLARAAATWRNFAEALRNAAGQLQGTADRVTAQYGTPYQNFGDRAAPLATWMTGVSTNADAVASGLSAASTTGSSAQTTMYQERYSVDQYVERIVGPEGVMSMGRASAIRFREAQAATRLNGAIDQWAAAYDAFQPGTIAPAPTRTTSGSAAGSGTATGSGATTGSGGGGGGSAALLSGGGGVAGRLTGSGTGTSGGAGSLVGSGGGGGTDFPDSSVVGPDGGDFAGWVRDPRTGFLIDPETGQEFDPVTGRWIDPVTGKPFGDVVQYATRMEGLNGGVNTGTGLLAGGGTGVGLSPLLSGSGGTGLAGLFGGILPPSLAATNPAASQLRQTATDSMAAKAYAAQQLALKEASQGGRPYLPPTQAGMLGFGGSRTGQRSRLVTEPGATWTSRAGRTGSGGAVEEEPLLGPGSRGAAGGRRGAAGRGGAFGMVEEEPLLGGSTAAGGSGRGAGRAGPRGRTAGLPGEPFEEGAGVTGARGGRGSGSAGSRAYLPPMQAGQAGHEEQRNRKRPDWLVEDDVWSADQQAGPAVLGED
jgi:hypothetical protein